MSARNVAPRHDDIRTRVASEDERLAGELVITTVGERNDPGCRRGRGDRWGRGSRVRRNGNVDRPLQLRLASPALVYDEDLLPRNVELVAVQERRRLRTKTHPVDQHVGTGNRANGRRAVGPALHDGMSGRHAFALDGQRGILIGANDHLSGGHRIASAAELEYQHAWSIPLGLAGASPNVSARNLRPQATSGQAVRRSAPAAI